MSRPRGLSQARRGPRKELQVPGARPETALCLEVVRGVPRAPGRRAGGWLSLLRAAVTLFQSPRDSSPSLWVGQCRQGIINPRRDLPGLPGQEGKCPQLEQETMVPRMTTELTPGAPQPQTHSPASLPMSCQARGLFSTTPHRCRGAGYPQDNTKTGLRISQGDWLLGAADRQISRDLAKH